VTFPNVFSIPLVTHDLISPTFCSMQSGCMLCEVDIVNIITLSENCSQAVFKQGFGKICVTLKS
jgi:hypothetical protein